MNIICINIYSHILLLMLALCPRAVFGAQTLRMKIADVDEKKRGWTTVLRTGPPASLKALAIGSMGRDAAARARHAHISRAPPH